MATDPISLVALPPSLPIPSLLPNLIVPALVAQLGDAAAWRYVEFFTANIRNPNTRHAYIPACGRFLVWCEQRGLPLAGIRPFSVAAYVEDKARGLSA